jgi:hypothetical protein
MAQARWLLLGLIWAALAAAQSALTWPRLVSIIQSAGKLGQSDKEVASYLRKQKLSFSLSDVQIEELQGMGAGPQTVAALRQLQQASKGLPPAPRLDAPAPAASARPVEPPPSLEEQKRIIEEARANALEYSRKLPDFICLQWTRRYVDPSGEGRNWFKYDEIKTRLTFFEQREEYKVISVNEQLTNRKYESLGGAISTGEFGSELAELFAPATAAEFTWNRHSVLHNRKVYVFNFLVPRERSQYHISYGPNREQDIVAGYKGLVYIDKETKMVLRISAVSNEVPPDFPIKEARTALEYGFTKIADRDYLLPTHATVRLAEARVITRNEVDFRLYRKFSAEATIAFEDAVAKEPKPDDKPSPEPEGQP